MKHILPKEMRTPNEDYESRKRKDTDASEHLIELFNNVVGFTNKAEAALAPGKVIPVIPTCNAAGWTSWKPKWLPFSGTVDVRLEAKWNECMWYAGPEEKKPEPNKLVETSSPLGAAECTHRNPVVGLYLEPTGDTPAWSRLW